VLGVSEVFGDLDAIGSMGAESDSVLIGTGISQGTVGLQIEALLAEPGPPDGTWEEVVEVTLRVPGPDPLEVSEIGLYNPTGPALAAEPGLYRLRVNAYGRDLDRDAVSDDTDERYLLQAWPVDGPTGIRVLVRK
jgi:hypothetical protein